MKESQLATGKFNNNFDSTLESPFYEKNGLLEFKEGFTEPEFFANWSFATNLYGEQVQPTFRRSLNKVDNIGDKLAQGSEESIFVHH